MVCRPHRSSSRRRAAFAILGSLLGAVAGAAGQAVAPGSYEITAQTVMPHLEENLRYATTRERRCLGRDSLASIFPILQHWSLDGCQLGRATMDGSATRYLLVCENPEVATGVARLATDAGRIVGTLEVKMGGKNMTFAQRIEATRQGECNPTP
jgi:hypothetical protein